MLMIFPLIIAVWFYTIYVVANTIQLIIKSYGRYRSRNAPFKPRIVIIGAGFSGICAAIKLKTELNYDNFIIIEKTSEFGGTWNINTYPGCASDVPGIEYAFTFENIKSWTPNYFPSQPETLEYLKSLARKYGLYEHIKFNTTVTGMQYDEAQKIWNIDVNYSSNTKEITESIKGNIVISGVGILSVKKIPNFKNMDKFRGETWHSFEWNHSYDLNGKSVGIIGTGASAMQIIPKLAKMPLKLYVYQRSLSHVLPWPRATQLSKNIWTIFNYIPYIQSIRRAMSFQFRDNVFYFAMKKGNESLVKRLDYMCRKFRKEQLKVR